MMCAKEFDSVLASPLGDFVRSPLGVRDAGGDVRAVYSIAIGEDFTVDAGFIYRSEKIFRLSLDDLTEVVDEARPPWWPTPRPVGGQDWVGIVIAGDSSTIWYTAYNATAFIGAHPVRVEGDERWTMNIYKLDSQLEVVDSWRWHQPSLGGGRAWNISPFGDSTALWGLARVHTDPQPWKHGGVEPGEMYLVELDPETMEIRRASGDLWGGTNADFRQRRVYSFGGGGNSSVIWVARRFNDPVRQRFFTQIMEYDPRDFSLVRVTDGPRSFAQGDERLEIDGIGGDSESIWLTQHRTAPPFHSILSELPRNFTHENRTIIQD